MAEKNKFVPPSKKEIREKYGISNEDFDVLLRESTPTAEELKESGSLLESVIDFLGVPTFLLKKGVIVLAVIFIPYWGPIATKNFQDCIVTTYNYYSEVVKHVADTSDPPRYVLTLQDPADIARNPIDLRTGSFPVGTGIYPISGSLPTG